MLNNIIIMHTRKPEILRATHPVIYMHINIVFGGVFAYPIRERRRSAHFCPA